jgi:cytochrome c
MNPRLNIALTAVLLGLSATLAGSALAADGAALFKSKTCWSCHGKDANTPIMPAYPKLAGQNADYAFNQMKDIKSGARTNGQAAAMAGVMGLVSEEEMRAIADWLSTQ